MWVELTNEIDSLESMVECVVDYVVINLKKVENNFWKDDFGKVKDLNTYTAHDLIENILRIRNEN